MITKTFDTFLVLESEWINIGLILSTNTAIWSICIKSLIIGLVGGIEKYEKKDYKKHIWEDSFAPMNVLQYLVKK